MSTMVSQTDAREFSSARVSIKTLVGAGDRIGKLLLPFVAVGLAVNVWRPQWMSVGGPSAALATASAIMLVPGVIMWAWSVALILLKVPRGELITTGPFALVKHPLYTAVALLVLPWVGFLFDSWLGAAIGVLLYVATRLYAPAEEQALAKTFGTAWNAYERKVLLPWL